MTDSQRTLWIINAGRGLERDERLRLWLSHGYCSVGYRAVEVRASADRDQIRASFKGTLSASQADQLHGFANDMVRDDLVVVRGSSNLHLGVVTGDYEYVDGSHLNGDRQRHRREVRWIRQIELSTDLMLTVFIRPTMVLRTDPELRAALLSKFPLADEWFEAMRYELATADSFGTYRPVPIHITAYPVYHDGQALASAHEEHNKAQNDLSASARRIGLVARRPVEGEPDADLYLVGPDGSVAVCEVKSIDGSNDTEQLRLGLGQILDYMDQLTERPRYATALLWTSRQPTLADRWARLCKRHGVCLGWPGRELAISECLISAAQVQGKS